MSAEVGRGNTPLCLLTHRPEGTYTHRMDRDWLFFDIDHRAYHAHHARAEAVDSMPAVVGVSRRGSVVRVNADGSSVDHDVDSAVWHSTTTPLPPGGSRASEGASLPPSPPLAPTLPPSSEHLQSCAWWWLRTRAPTAPCAVVHCTFPTWMLMRYASSPPAWPKL